MIRYIFNYLTENKTDKIAFVFSPTLISVKKDGRNLLGIKSTQSSIDIEHIQDKTGIEYLKSYNLKIASATGSSERYHKVRFQNLSEFEKSKDAIIEYMNS